MQVDLFPAVRSLVFQSAVDVLFGPLLLKGTPAQGGSGGGAPAAAAGAGSHAEEFEEAFFDFEAGFEVRSAGVRSNDSRPGFEVGLTR